MNMQNILAGLGKAMTPADKGRTMATKLGMSPNNNFVLKSGSLPDNEPRMEDRDQVFSIEARIQNLLKSYQMFIDDQDFDRAQQVANEINMLDVQKRQAQAQNVPQQDDISRILDSISI